MLQRKPPNMDGHLFTMGWYSNPFITKAVISHLVTVKEGDEDSDKIIKQMSLVEVTFDPKNEESVMATIVSVYTHLDVLKLLSIFKRKWLSYATKSYKGHYG